MKSGEGVSLLENLWLIYDREIPQLGNMGSNPSGGLLDVACVLTKKSVCTIKAPLPLTIRVNDVVKSLNESQLLEKYL